MNSSSGSGDSFEARQVVSIPSPPLGPSFLSEDEWDDLYLKALLFMYISLFVEFYSFFRLDTCRVLCRLGFQI